MRAEGGAGRGRILRKAILALAAVLVLTAGWWFLLGTGGGKRPSPPLPDPNGFETLVRAAGLVRITSEEAVREAPLEELRAVVADHREALALAREGLRQESRIPPSCLGWPPDLEPFRRIRALVAVFQAEAALAEREGRLDEAVAIHGEVIALGNEMARGGLAIHWLIATRVRGSAIDGIHHLAAYLPSASCRSAIGMVRKTSAAADSLEAVLAREREYIEDHASLLSKLYHGAAGSEAIAEGNLRALAGKEESRRRLLLAELALRAHRLDRGSYPGGLEGLVPEYLDSIPLDPFSGKHLVYRLEGERYALHGVGKDGKDDGGPGGDGDDIALEDPGAGEGR